MPFIIMDGLTWRSHTGSECLLILLNTYSTAVLGTLPSTTEVSEGLLLVFIFFLVDLLRVDHLEFKTEFHL